MQRFPQPSVGDAGQVDLLPITARASASLMALIRSFSFQTLCSAYLRLLDPLYKLILALLNTPHTPLVLTCRPLVASLSSSSNGFNRCDRWVV